MELQDFLRQIKFNGQSLDRGGTVDATAGGYTVSNAPAVYARLLQQLSQPGGALSSLESSRVLGGQVSSIVSQGDQERRSFGTRLSNAGLNEGQAAAALSGVDTSVMRAISEARAAEERRLSGAKQEALTGFANVVAQSESTQKERAEQLRQFEIALKEMRKQQRFSRIVSIASLGISAFGAGFFSGLGGMFFPGTKAPGEATKPLSNQAGGALGSLPPLGGFQADPASIQAIMQRSTPTFGLPFPQQFGAG